MIDDTSDTPSTSSSVSSMSLSSSSVSLADGFSVGSNPLDLGVRRFERFVRSTSYLKVGGKLMRPSLKPLRTVLFFIRTLSSSNSSA